MIDRKFAENIMEIWPECCDQLTQIIYDAKDGASKEVADVIRKRVERVMGLLLVELESPICEQHPDLTRPGLLSSRVKSGKS